jgi:hypothetical protein
MTLYDVVVIGGLTSSTLLLAILASLWAFERKEHVLCFKTMQDEECTPVCLRTCHLKAA